MISLRNFRAKKILRNLIIIFADAARRGGRRQIKGGAKMAGIPAWKQVVLIACLLLCAVFPAHAQQQGQQTLSPALTNELASTALSLEKFSLRIATARQIFADAREHPDDHALAELGNSLVKIIREDQSRQETRVTMLARTMLSSRDLRQFDEQIRQQLLGLVPASIVNAVQSSGGAVAILQNSSKIIADSVEDLGKFQRRGDAGDSLLGLVGSAHAQGAPRCAIFLLAMAACAALEQPACVITMGASYLNCATTGG
jgi:hypothetical protein